MRRMIRFNVVQVQQGVILVFFFFWRCCGANKQASLDGDGGCCCGYTRMLSLSHDMIPPIMTTTVTTRRQVTRGWCFVSGLVLLPKVLSATRENGDLILGSTLTMVAARLSWVDANGSCSKQHYS